MDLTLLREIYKSLKVLGSRFSKVEDNTTMSIIQLHKDYNDLVRLVEQMRRENIEFKSQLSERLLKIEAVTQAK